MAARRGHPRRAGRRDGGGRGLCQGARRDDETCGGADARPEAKLGGSRRTLCSAISPDGKHAVSDTHALRLFQLIVEEGGEYRIEKQDTPKGVNVAQQLVFTLDGKVLIAVELVPAH